MSTTLSAVPEFSNPPITPIQGWSNSFINIQNDRTGVNPLYAQASYLTNIRADGSLPVIHSKAQKDVVNKLRVSNAQNIYEADFEYGAQPLRWENLTTGSGVIKHLPQNGAVQMQLNAIGDVTIRQSRPYHRYQPGKAMFMATAVVFGFPYVGQVQRVGFFDDSNGVFFEQGNPSTNNPAGMYVVVRSDINGLPNDIKIDFSQWSDPFGIKNSLDWSKIQMLWVSYAWYGAGALRWGVLINGEEYTLHEIGAGNSYVNAWARTGNLPVRYEQRDTGTGQPSTLTHYGVSVMIEGGRDTQRGFTYSYGTGSTLKTLGTNINRNPIISVRNKTIPVVLYSGSTIGTATYPLNTGGPVAFTTTINPTQSLSGLFIYFPTLTGNGYQNGLTGRIFSNNVGSLTCVDVAIGLSANNIPLSGIFAAGNGVSPTTPIATAPIYPNIPNGTPFQIGLINRGQILPQELLINSNANAYLEFFVSTPNNPIILNNNNWVSMSSLSSYNSFAEINTTSTSFTGGECVYGFWVNGYTDPSAGSLNAQYQIQDKDLSFFFPLYNNIKGNNPDILTLAITYVGSGGNGAKIGANILGQEAMS